jgi:F0F1-type ATP synthase membrane subunit c/vacuolar-type H+-ATPase subunit K
MNVFLYSNLMPQLRLVLFVLLFLFILPKHVFAQAPTVALPSTAPAAAQGNSGRSASTATLGVAQMVEMKDPTVKNGTIVSTSPKGAILSNVPYDAHVVGIVSRDAAIILNSVGTKNAVPIISNGTVYVLVSTKGGAIKKGDLLTTSVKPGIGVKAEKDGYVLGTALEDYSSSNPDQADLIAVDLDLHYFNAKPTFPGTLSDIFKIALLPTKDSPTPIFKYIVAAAVVLGSFVLGFLSFGRTAAKGVEALGRNPAASRIIHLGIIFNVGIVVTIVMAGLVVAFLILRL